MSRFLLILLLIPLPSYASDAENDSLDVGFRFNSSGATHVSIAGSFNNWSAGAHAMKREGDVWTLTLKLPPGYYYYKFVVDGIWIPDPENPLRINDGGNSFNSVLKVGSPPRPRRKSAATPLPREKLPKPILESDSELVDLYYAAWNMAWAKISLGTDRNGFSEAYMDEGFNELIYQWDTCFMTVFGVYARNIFPVMPSLDNFYRKQRDDGYIQRVYRETTGLQAQEPTRDEPMVNPPLFAWTELRYYLISGDDSRLSRVLPVLVRYYQWIESHCRAQEGKGLYYVSPLGSGMDNTPRPDVGKAGWIDFSAQQALAAKSIAAIAGAVGNHMIEREFLEKHRHIAEQINTRCWNKAERFYFDLTQSDTLSRTKHIGAFWTLLSGVSNREQAEGLVGHLQNTREFWRPHVVPTLSADDRNYDAKGHYWRGSVWAPTNYMVVKGLEEYQRFSLADDIASNHLKNMAHVFSHFAVDEANVAYEERYGDGYHTIWECYSSERMEPATRWDSTFYSRQDFVGWSGLGPIAMLIENVLGISAEGYENRIRWRIHRTDRHGIENIQLRDQRVTLLCSPKGAGAEVTVTSEKPFTLEVFFRGKFHKKVIAPKGKTSFPVE